MLRVRSLVVSGLFVVIINVSHFCDLKFSRLLTSIKIFNILSSSQNLKTGSYMS